jgi:hypothetical protein
MEPADFEAALDRLDYPFRVTGSVTVSKATAR